jgi:hypothetical protein
MYFITSRRILNRSVRLNGPLKEISEALSRVGHRCQSNHPQRPGTLCFQIVGLIGHQVVYEHCLAKVFHVRIKISRYVFFLCSVLIFWYILLNC